MKTGTFGFFKPSVTQVCRVVMQNQLLSRLEQKTTLISVTAQNQLILHQSRAMYCLWNKAKQMSDSDSFFINCMAVVAAIRRKTNKLELRFRSLLLDKALPDNRES